MSIEGKVKMHFLAWKILRSKTWPDFNYKGYQQKLEEKPCWVERSRESYNFYSTLVKREFGGNNQEWHANKTLKMYVWHVVFGREHAFVDK